MLTDLHFSLSEAADLGDGPSGTLRITVPRVAMPIVIEPVLAEFAQAAPRVVLDLVLDDGLVDLALDKVMLQDVIKRSIWSALSLQDSLMATVGFA